MLAGFHGPDGEGCMLMEIVCKNHGINAGIQQIIEVRIKFNIEILCSLFNLAA